MPVFLIQPIKDFNLDIGSLKEILLNLGTEETFVSRHHAIIIFPAHINKIMAVMGTCGCHAIRMYDAMYPADGMELIPIVEYALRCVISPGGSRIDIVTSHGTAFSPCVPADLYRLGTNAGYILGTINRDSHILADFFGKTSRQFTPDIEQSSADQVWQILLALMVKAMKKEILAVESESLGGYAQSHYFEVGKLRDNATAWYVPEPSSFTRFPAKSLQIPRILTKFAMKLRINSAIVVNGMVTTNLRIICQFCNFPIYKYLEI